MTRGQCPVCKKPNVKISRAGRIQLHTAISRRMTTEVCAAVGRRLTEAAVEPPR